MTCHFVRFNETRNGLCDFPRVYFDDNLLWLIGSAYSNRFTLHVTLESMYSYVVIKFSSILR